VQALRVPEHSAAQNMYPSMPADVAPLFTFGTTLRTKLDVNDCSDFVKLVHSGITLLPTRYTDPVNRAGASGGIGGAYCGLPSTCSCQFAIASLMLGCRAGTMAFA